MLCYAPAPSPGFSGHYQDLRRRNSKLKKVCLCPKPYRVISQRCYVNNNAPMPFNGASQAAALPCLHAKPSCKIGK